MNKPDDSNKFILINTYVPNYEQLIKAINSKYLIVDSFDDYCAIDNFFIKNKFRNISTFAFIFDNNNIFMPFFPNDNEYFGDLFCYFISSLVVMNKVKTIDLISCNINTIRQKKIIANLEQIYKIDIRYSLNKTGNYHNGGDWIMESDNINIKDLYFNSNINNWHYTLYSSYFSNKSEKLLLDISNNQIHLHVDINNNPLTRQYDSSGYNISTYTGKIVTWGDITSGGDMSSVSSVLQSNIKTVYSNYGAFAALTTSGSIITWGDSAYGGDMSTVSSRLQSGVVGIYSTNHAFAVLKQNGSVVAWGNNNYGGNMTTVSSRLQSGVKYIFANERTFAALKDNGSVVVWGWGTFGATMSTSVSSRVQSNVKAIYSTINAFAALRENGSVVAWGNSTTGGNYAATISARLQSNVKAIFSTTTAFAALKQDGSVVTWGSSSTGGTYPASISSSLQSKIKIIYSNTVAFAALTISGRVITWGDVNSGGSIADIYDSVQSDVKTIYSTAVAFAALKTDGSVIVWGDAYFGGTTGIYYNTEMIIDVYDQVQDSVKAIYGSAYSFFAIKQDNSIVAWGEANFGADTGIYTNGSNILDVTSELQSGILSLTLTDTAAAVVKNNGKVVSWGDSVWGGDMADSSGNLQASVRNIYSTNAAYAALIFNNLPTGIVTISGPIYQYDTLTIDTSTISDIDGLGDFSYQWYQSDTSNGIYTGISDAINTTLTLSQNEVGKYIKIIVSYIDGLSALDTVTSNCVGPIINVNDPPIGTVTISGILAQYNTLLVSVSLTDLDGISGTYSYQWINCKDISGTYTNISGAITTELLLDRSHINRYIKIIVSYTDNYNTVESVASDAYGPIIEDPAFCINTILGTIPSRVTNFLDISTNYLYNDISYNWYSFSDISFNNPQLVKIKKRLFVITECALRYVACKVIYNTDYETLHKYTNLVYVYPQYNVDEFDYILTLNVGSSQMNTIFNTAYYSVLNDNNVDISFNFNNDNLYNYFTQQKTSISYANSIVNMGGFQKTKSSFGNRLLEVMAMKIFGHPMAKAAISNSIEFRDVSGIIMKTQSSLDSSKLAVFNYYVGLEKATTAGNFDFTNAEITFPVYMTGHVSRLFEEEYMLKNGPHVGGALVVNGMYNVPLLFKIK